MHRSRRPTADAKPKGRQAFQKARALEQRYARELRGVAREIGRIVKGFVPGTAESADAINKVLTKYAEMLKPWAKSVAGRLVADLDAQDRKEWERNTRGMSVVLRAELAKEHTGATLQELLEQHVHLITSLPLEAAQRVHRLTYEALSDSGRAKEIAADILATGEVTKSRANLIARTETGRTATTLLQVRAQGIGSDGYIWRTSRDPDVRKSHAAMEGQFVKWSEPPTLDKLTGHAGCVPNCRCYAEPIIPENLL